VSADFADAFRAGLRAATEADAARAEIDAVLADLDAQLRGAYGVTATLTADAIVLAREGRTHRLCSVEIDRMGYPVVFDAPGVREVARSRAGMARALCAVLATSDTGRGIEALLRGAGTP